MPSGLGRTDSTLHSWDHGSRGECREGVGTIEVVVHEPLPTAGWSRDDINKWLPMMRQLYIDTLDDWPGAEAGKSWSAAIAQASALVSCHGRGHGAQSYAGWP